MSALNGLRGRRGRSLRGRWAGGDGEGGLGGRGGRWRSEGKQVEFRMIWREHVFVDEKIMSGDE